jgi:signal transduction histidine kinase
MLFTRFFRGRVAQEFAVQGTGLGLSIVQSIVQSHGGEVSIRSSEHVGTDVRVVLPLVPAKHRMDGALR